jgi:hypothetical protein
MNYITNYYKNLSEQLQRKVNILTRNLYEEFDLPGKSQDGGYQNLIQPQQPNSAVTGIIPQTVNRLSKAEDNIKLEPTWYNLILNAYSAGDPTDPAAFAQRYAYILNNWNNMTFNQRVGTLGQMMSNIPGTMTGAQFLALFPAHVQSFLNANFGAVQTFYYDIYGPD